MLETQENSEVVSLAGRMFPSTKNTVFKKKKNLTDQILEINYNMRQNTAELTHLKDSNEKNCQVLTVR